MMGRSLGSSVEIAEGSARSGKFGEKVERIVMLLSIWLSSSEGRFLMLQTSPISISVVLCRYR